MKPHKDLRLSTQLSFGMAVAMVTGKVNVDTAKYVVKKTKFRSYLPKALSVED